MHYISTCPHIAQYKPYVNTGNNIAYLRHRFIDCNGARTHNHLVRKWTLNYLAKLVNLLSCVVSTYLYGVFDSIYVIIISYMRFRVNLHSIVCLNAKELLARNRCHIWSLSDCNRIWTHNHLVHKWTLNHHLPKLAKWLSCVVSTHFYSAFDCVIIMSHTRFRVNLHPIVFPECQGTFCSKQI